MCEDTLVQEVHRLKNPAFIEDVDFTNLPDALDREQVEDRVVAVAPVVDVAEVVDRLEAVRSYFQALIDVPPYILRLDQPDTI